MEESHNAKPQSKTIFRTEGLKKVYGEGTALVRALRGVDLEIPEGEIVVLLGPSGSGKSTLLNIIGGLDHASEGRVWFRDQELTAMTDRQLVAYRRDHLGFVFQFYNLMPVLTAVENVELPLLVGRVRAGDARRRAVEALALVGLADRAHHVPDALSGGERQRATIARSLVNDPAIVWADEPTGDLDSENAAEIVELMRRLNVEQGLTFLIVTHDIAVGRRTDRIVRMLDGLVVEEQRLEVPHVLAGHAA